MVNTNYSVDALNILLEKDCLSERYYLLCDCKNTIIEGLKKLGCRYKDEALNLTQKEYEEIGLENDEQIRLFCRFLKIYDPNPSKFKEIKTLDVDEDKIESFRQLYYLPGVKYTRANLYYLAGYRSLNDFVDTTVEQVQHNTAKAIADNQLSCIVPLAKEIRTHIAVAIAFSTSK